MLATKQFNRRRHERFQLSPMYSTVTVHQSKADTIRRLSGHAYDISESGARIELDEALDPGQHINVQFRLPGLDRPLIGEARVIWHNDGDDDPGPCRIAIEFISLPDAERCSLLDYLGSGGVLRAA